MKIQTEADRFRDFVKRIIAIPKSEIDKRQAAYQKAKAARKAKA